MVDLQGQIVPTSDEEYELLQDLYEVTGKARKAGVPTEEISVSLMFVASSILAYEDQEAMGEPPERPADQRRDTCPNCGEEIGEVDPYMGGDVEILPCGCYVEAKDIPGWTGL